MTSIKNIKTRYHTTKGFAFKSPEVNKLNFVTTYRINYLNLIINILSELYNEFNCINTTVVSIL